MQRQRELVFLLWFSSCASNFLKLQRGCDAEKCKLKSKRSRRALQNLEFLAASAASMCSAPFSPFLLYKLRFGATSDVEVQKWSFLRKKVSV